MPSNTEKNTIFEHFNKATIKATKLLTLRCKHIYAITE